MNLPNIIRNIDKKFAWNFIGFIVGLFLSLLAIYFRFIDKPKMAMEFLIMSEVQLIDIKEKISSLNIFYNGIDIAKNNMVVKIYLIKVVNSGNKSILSIYYDKEAPLKMVVRNGQIAELPVVEKASNEYLKNNYRMQLINNQLYFPNAIIDSNDEIVFKLILIHDSKTIPEINLMGKIAGIKYLKLENYYSRKNTITFLKQIVGGDLKTQVSRVIFYSLIIFIGVLLLMLPFIYRSRFNQNKRLKWSRAYRKENKIFSIDREYSFVLNSYINNGSQYLLLLNNLITDDEYRQKTYSKLISNEALEVENDLDLFIRVRSITVLRDLLSCALLNIENGKINKNKKMQNYLDNFINYLSFKDPAISRYKINLT